MNGFEKLIVFILLIAWIWGGYYLIRNFKRIFGKHRDDPSETSAARLLGQTQIWSVWIGMIICGIYIIFKN